jgi:hypothetical protein
VTINIGQVETLVVGQVPDLQSVSMVQDETEEDYVEEED